MGESGHQRLLSMKPFGRLQEVVQALPGLLGADVGVVVEKAKYLLGCFTRLCDVVDRYRPPPRERSLHSSDIDHVPRNMFRDGYRYCVEPFAHG